MTKALTEGARRRRKRMARETDPIAASYGREADGRPRRQGVTENLAEHPVSARRLLRMGRNPKDATAQELAAAARDVRLATLAGCLYAAKRIPEAAYLGVMEYARVHHRWTRGIGSPPAFPAYASHVPKLGGHEPEIVDSLVDRLKRDANAYMNAEGALLASGCKPAVVYALTAPEEIGVDDVASGFVESVEKGGMALAFHFGFR